MAMILLIPRLNNSISLLLPTELAIASSTSNREFKNIYVLCEIHVLPSRLTLNIQHYSTFATSLWLYNCSLFSVIFPQNRHVC